MSNPTRNWRYKHKETGEVIQFDFYRESPKPYQFHRENGEILRMEPSELEQYDQVQGRFVK